MTGSAGGERQQIRRRRVLLFPGFEPLGAEQHRGRFEHALMKTGPVFGAQFSASALYVRPSGLPGLTVTGFGEGWRTQTDIVIFDWSPVLEHFAARNPLARFASGLSALFGFTVRGTLFRYIKTSWRYGLFFAYPLVLLLACLFVGLISRHFAGDGIAGWLIGLLSFGAGLAFASIKAHLLLMMDDWAFASRLAAGGHSIIEQTLVTFRSAMEAELHESADETLVIGHSLGCVFAVDALSACTSPDQDNPSLMTTGSSLLKIALDRRAGWLRNCIGNLAASRVVWLDVQSLTDPISFYGSNPAVSSGFDSPSSLKTLRIRFRTMLSPETYAKGKFNLFRTHRQFVLAAERPYFYSMHMIACGPYPFGEIWTSNGLPQQGAAARKQD